MTAPRIISAAEAEELRRVSDAAVESMTATDAGEAETRADTRAAVLVRDLAASVVALHAEVEHLRRVVALERADESAAMPGWHWNQHDQYWYSDDGWGIWRSQTSSWSVWLGRIERGHDGCPIKFRNCWSFPMVWNAMHAWRCVTP